MRAQKIAEVIDDEFRLNPKEAMILLRVVRVFDECHLLRALYPVQEQPLLVAEAVEATAHQIYGRHVHEVSRKKGRYLRMQIGHIELLFDCVNRKIEIGRIPIIQLGLCM